MGNGDLISRRQLFCCVYLSMVVEMLIKPFSRPVDLPAQVLIPAAAVNLLLLWLVLAPLGAARSGAVARAGGTLPGRMVLVLMAATLLLSGGGTLNEANGFLSFTGDWQLSFFWFLPLVLALVYYAVRLGIEGVARVSGVVFVLFLLSIGVVVISNLREMRLQNLAVEAQPFMDTAKAVGQGFSFSPALLAGIVLSEKTQRGRDPRLAHLLAALFATYFVFTMVSELVLGGFATAQRQPVYTLARIGGLSVFRRLDSLHSSIWLMALVLKLVVEGAAVELLLRRLLPARWQKYGVALTAGLTGAAGLLFHFSFPTGLRRWLTAAGVLAVLLLALVSRKEKKRV